MPVLPNSKHELFAQAIARGVSRSDAYVGAGYSKGGASHNAARLIQNDTVSARIKELHTGVAEQLVVVVVEASKRSYRMLQLQNRLDGMLRLQRARAVMYAGQLAESHEFEVNTPEEEAAAIANGCRERERPYCAPVPPAVVPPLAPPPVPAAGEAGAFRNPFVVKDPPACLKNPPPRLPIPPARVAVYPKVMVHPGYPNGGGTGMLVKDYRGKNAEKEIWKFDGALVAQILDTLKQAAIEVGDWGEKREKPVERLKIPRVTVIFPPQASAGAPRRGNM